MSRRTVGSFFEILESRRLLDGDESFSAPARLIGQDRLIDDFSSLTGAGQTVAIIDTGIDYTNAHLGGGIGPAFKVIGGRDFVDNDDDPLDTSGHGTAVASLIAGDSYVQDGVRHQGIAPASRLIALRVAQNTATAPNARIEQALQWVLDHREEFGITVVNISFGFGRYQREPEDGQFAVELANLAEFGVIVTASSGNNASAEPGINYPAADQHAIAVGSVDPFDVISEFTQRGSLLDVLAPGEGWEASWINGQTRQVSGTSYAAPIVAGAAALIKQLNPTITPADAMSILRAGSEDNLDGDEEFGATTNLRFPRIDLPAIARIAQSRLPADANEPDPWPAARNNALSFDRDGVLHVAFYDAAEHTLKYKIRLTTGEWTGTQVVDAGGGNYGQYLSLALDSFGRPGIAYFDATNGDLRHARLVQGEFGVEVVDSRQSVGLYPSTLFDHDNQPVIAYYQRSKGDLRVARLAMAGWKIDDIDATPNNRGRSVSLAENSFGRFAAAYEDSTTGKLKFAAETGNGWVVDTIDNDTTGVSFISAAFDSADRLAVSYYDATPADLKFAITDDLFLPRWRTQTIANKGAVGLFTSLVFDSDDTANVIYYSRKDNALFLARGSVDHMMALRLHSGGGRFAWAATQPETGAIQYTWLATADQSLRFSSTEL